MFFIKFGHSMMNSIFKSYDVIEIGKNLLTIEGNELRLFEAIDDDAGIYGDITYQITSNNDDSLYFEMVKLNRKKSQLKTTRIIEERSYTVNNLINFLFSIYLLGKSLLCFSF